MQSSEILTDTDDWSKRQSRKRPPCHKRKFGIKTSWKVPGKANGLPGFMSCPSFQWYETAKQRDEAYQAFQKNGHSWSSQIIEKCER